MTEKHIVCLWARSDRYPQPQFVGAISESLADAWVEVADELREKAEAWFAGPGGDDGPWQFWVTYERLTCDPLAQLAVPSGENQ